MARWTIKAFANKSLPAISTSPRSVIRRFISIATIPEPARYLEKPELAPFEEELYRKVFSALRQAKIVCVVFETGRTAAYQKMIDAHPELSRLQSEWRAFFQGESHDGVKFLDGNSTRDCYADEDFFDAVHFLGPTGTRLATRLANELAALEKGDSDGQKQR